LEFFGMKNIPSGNPGLKAAVKNALRFLWEFLPKRMALGIQDGNIFFEMFLVLKQPLIRIMYTHVHTYIGTFFRYNKLRVAKISSWWFRDRFYEQTFWPQTFWVNFHPQILDKFPLEDSKYNFIRLLRTIILNCKVS
jgi:hypothetical protein